MLSIGFYKRYGKEALPVITEVMSQGGVASAKAMREMAPAKNMKDVAENFKMMASMMGVKPELVESSDKVFHFKMSKCPLCIEGTSKELCEALMAHDAKMASTLLGKDLNMKIPKSVAAGDKECEVIFSIK